MADRSGLNIQGFSLQNCFKLLIEQPVTKLSIEHLQEISVSDAGLCFPRLFCTAAPDWLA